MCVKTTSKMNIDKVLGHLTMSGIITDNYMRSLFGDFINPDADVRVYDEIADLKQLTGVMEQ